MSTSDSHGQRKPRRLSREVIYESSWMNLKGAKEAGLKTAYVHREDDWWRVFPTNEPTLPLETFDVSASDYDDLVEKLT